MDPQLCVRVDALGHEFEEIAARLRAGSDPEPAQTDRDVERALECLIEAKMRLRGRSATEDDEVSRLRDAVARLAEALVEVRVARTGREPLAHGFVLPRGGRGG